MSAKFCQYVSLLAPDRVVGQILVAGCPAGEIPLPREMTDDWLSREGDPARLAEVAEPYMTRPVEPRAAGALRRATRRRSAAPRSRAR